MTAFAQQPPSAARYYVDKDADGKATGLSWTDAYTNVQDALAAAQSGAEIWVAGASITQTWAMEKAATTEASTSPFHPA